MRFSVITQPIVKKDERRMVERASSRQAQEVTPQLPKKPTVTEALSNEALEKKLEEILK